MFRSRVSSSALDQVNQQAFDFAPQIDSPSWPVKAAPTMDQLAASISEVLKDQITTLLPALIEDTMTAKMAEIMARMHKQYTEALQKLQSEMSRLTKCDSSFMFATGC